MGNKDLEVRDLVLKLDKLNKPKDTNFKFQNLWLGPFQISEKIGNKTYRLNTLQGKLERTPVNGQNLER